MTNSMDQQVITTLLAANVSAMGAAIHAWRVLALHGLVSAEDIDEMAHGLNVPFDGIADIPYAQQIRAILDGHLAPHLAELQRIARANYKAGGSRG